MNNKNDLWPDDIVPKVKLELPVNILKEQGVTLGEKTGNIIRGEVESNSDAKLFVYKFYITSPALGYKYELLQIRHEIAIYPVFVLMETEILNETRQAVLETIPDGISLGSGNLIAENSNAFKEILKLIFGSTKARRVISSLISLTEK
jgi:hypothetical protein